MVDENNSIDVIHSDKFIMKSSIEKLFVDVKVDNLSLYEVE